MEQIFHTLGKLAAAIALFAFILFTIVILKRKTKPNIVTRFVKDNPWFTFFLCAAIGTILGAIISERQGNADGVKWFTIVALFSVLLSILCLPMDDTEPEELG